MLSYKLSLDKERKVSELMVSLQIQNFKSNCFHATIS